MLSTMCMACGLVGCDLGGEGIPIVNYHLSRSIGLPFYKSPWTGMTSVLVAQRTTADGSSQYDYRWRNGCFIRIIVDPNGIIADWSYLDNSAVACSKIMSSHVGV